MKSVRKSILVRDRTGFNDIVLNTNNNQIDGLERGMNNGQSHNQSMKNVRMQTNRNNKSND